jgi:ABC-type phosphate transport system substrate-binding protein
MMRRRSHHLLSATVALGLAVALGAGSQAATDDYKVVVHPDNPAPAVDRAFLREIYLRKATDWSGLGPIRPIELTKRFAVRERFAHEVLKKTTAQLKVYWNQQIFSGKGVPPPEADTPAAAVAYVLANPGAIAYLPADSDPGRAKVIRVQ